MAEISLYLHGSLKSFGGPFCLQACHPAEAISALSQQLKGFEQRLRVGRFHLIAGNRKNGNRKNGRRLKGPDCYDPLATGHLHLVPVASGASGRGPQALLGLTLLGLSFAPGLLEAAGGPVARQLLGQAGSVLMLRSLQSASFGTRAATSKVDTSSELISAPRSTAEGQPVPLLYGRRFVQAPPVIFSGLTVEIEKL